MNWNKICSSFDLKQSPMKPSKRPLFKKIVAFTAFLLFFLISTNAIDWHWPFSHDLSKVTSIAIVFDSSKNILPGGSVDFGIICTYPDGKKKFTKGLLNGDLPWREFDITVNGGSSLWGNMDINEQLHPGDYAEVKVIVKDNPNITGNRLIPLNKIVNIKLIPIEPIYRTPGYDVKYFTEIRLDNGNNITLKNPWDKEIETLKLQYKSFGCTFNNKKISISSNIDQIVDSRVVLACKASRYPFAADTLVIGLDYKDPQSFGQNGLNGFSGSSGSSGNPGISGSNGGHGGHGFDGYHGQDGEHGAPGPVIHVFVNAYFDSAANARLLYAEVQLENNSNISKYLVNTSGGTLSISSTGGMGGFGGNGGSGGMGGKGGDGKVTYTTRKDSTGSHTVEHKGPGGNGGRGGRGGDGGYGGAGGQGGIVYVDFTAQAEPYLNCLHITVTGGNGGSGGFAGTGGMGGSGGNPGGRSGYNGENGLNGRTGYNGPDGMVYYRKVQ